MIYSVNYVNLTEKINPHVVAKYLKDTGWSLYNSRKDYVKIFQNKNDKGEFFQSVVPLDKTLADYKVSMYDAIEQISLYENKSVEQIMLYLLNPNTDILKIRLQKTDIVDGSIYFDDAINLFENTKKLIAAATQDVIHPKRFHQGRQEDAVSEFVNNCRFGQTEIGSYVISVVCPFAELNDAEEYKQLSIFSDEEQCANSLTRKVTNRIMNNISLIKENIDNGEIDRLVLNNSESMISANFYEALSGMNIEEENTSIEFTAQWSPLVKNENNVKSKVNLTHDYYQPLRSTVDKLREKINTHTKIVGRVKKLESLPDASIRTNGKVTVVYLDSANNKRNVTVQLEKEDYNMAIKAHECGSHVELIGEFEDNGKRTQTMTCESFSIIE